MGKLEEDIKVLWDLETLGIAESDRVYEEFVDNITLTEIGIPSRCNRRRGMTS